MSGMRPHAAFARPDSVRAAWVDYNGHMGDYAYAIAFSETVTAYMDVIGLDPAWRAAERSTLYTLDLRIGYLRECHAGAPLDLSLHVLAADGKRLHLFLEMCDERGGVLAWCEQVLLHVSQAGEVPRAAPFPEAVAERLAADQVRSAPVRPVAVLARPIGLARG